VSNPNELGAASAQPANNRAAQPEAASYLSRRGRATVVAVAAALLLAGITGWLIILWKAIEARSGRFDFSHYYAAARALHLDPHANIYSMAVLSASATASHVVAPPDVPYLYPPLPALLFIPLTAFSFPVAADIFFAVNVVAWLLCMLFVAREVRLLLGTSLAAREDAPPRGMLAGLLANPAPLVALAICAPLFFIGRPSVSTLGNGQINFLVLLPLACVPWLTRRGSERGVGVAIAIATMLKLTPGVLLVYLLLRGRWRALGAALIALAVLCALCLLVVGPHVFFAYPATVLQTGGANSSLANNEALFAPVLLAITTANPGLAPAARMCEYVLLGVLAVELGAGAMRLTADALRSEALAYAMALAAVVLLSPAAWAHHYVWLLPSVALVLALTIRAIAIHPTYTRGAGALLVGAIAAGVLLNLPLPYGWDTDPAARTLLLLGLPLRPWMQELRPLGGLLVVAVAATLLLRIRSTTATRMTTWISQTPNPEIPARLPASQP
jgi:Glycosyltransferase family 87